MEDYLKMTINTYDQIALSYVNSTRERQPQQEFDSFCRAVVPQAVILDVGCGWGRDCVAFVNHGFSVIGLDLSKSMLKLAEKHAPLCTFYEADMRKIPLNDNSVDGIWCCASLLHLKRSQTLRAFKEFRRVLRNGAVCCIIVKKGTGENVDKGFSQSSPRFFTYFHEDEIRKRFRSANFIILDEHVTNEQDNGKGNGRDQEWIYFLVRKVQS